MQKKAVVLLSGGLDSVTALALAKEQGYELYALSIDYQQRHQVEVSAAKNIATLYGVVRHEVIKLDLSQFGGSALTDQSLDIPQAPSDGIPITYVPARNTVFLSLALAFAESQDIRDIFIGVNAVDYSGYPDCREQFIRAFNQMANLATKAGIENKPFKIHTPLIHLSKSSIIEAGLKLGIDYSLTISCYQASENGQACGVCDSCRLRRQGFIDLGVEDPTIYKV